MEFRCLKGVIYSSKLKRVFFVEWFTSSLSFIFASKFTILPNTRRYCEVNGNRIGKFSQRARKTATHCVVSIIKILLFHQKERKIVAMLIRTIIQVSSMDFVYLETLNTLDRWYCSVIDSLSDLKAVEHVFYLC